MALSMFIPDHRQTGEMVRFGHSSNDKIATLCGPLRIGYPSIDLPVVRCAALAVQTLVFPLPASPVTSVNSPLAITPGIKYSTGSGSISLAALNPISLSRETADSTRLCSGDMTTFDRFTITDSIRSCTSIWLNPCSSSAASHLSGQPSVPTMRIP